MRLRSNLNKIIRRLDDTPYGTANNYDEMRAEQGEDTVKEVERNVIINPVTGESNEQKIAILNHHYYRRNWNNFQLEIVRGTRKYFISTLPLQVQGERRRPLRRQKHFLRFTYHRDKLKQQALRCSLHAWLLTSRTPATGCLLSHLRHLLRPLSFRNPTMNRCNEQTT